MKKIVVGMLIFSLLLSLCACGNSAYVGRYEGVYAEAEGQVYLMEDYFNGENHLELKKNGKAEMLISNSVHKLKWKESDGEITFTEAGDVFYGYVADGIVQLDFMGWGLVLTFAMEGAEVPETTVLDPEAQAEALKATDEYWNGDWYGWWEITDGTGAYADQVGLQTDLYATVELTEGRGEMKIWELGEDKLLADTVLRVEPNYGTPGIGIAMSGRGEFRGCEIESGDWLIDPSLCNYEELLEISGYYADEQGDYFYILYLRPYGTLWEDVRAAVGSGVMPNGLPASYGAYVDALNADLDMNGFRQSLMNISE